MELSKNFDLGTDFKSHKNQLNPIELFLLKSLCVDILQPIREFLACPCKITNGVRTLSDYDRLLDAGYYPSETSDHFLGLSVPLRSSKKIAKFGHFYHYATGAADVVPTIGAREAWDRMRPYFNPTFSTIELPTGTIKIGQFIFEVGTRFDWLHISNPATLVNSEKFSQKFLSKTPFLVSNNNGKSYQNVF